MNKYIILIIISISITTSSFARESTMTRVLQSWFNYPIDSVIDKWGFPDKEKTIAKKHLFYWNNKQRIFVNGSWKEYICDRILEVNSDNIVIGGQYSGNNCPITYTTAKRWVNPDSNYWKNKKEKK